MYDEAIDVTDAEEVLSQDSGEIQVKRADTRPPSAGRRSRFVSARPKSRAGRPETPELLDRQASIGSRKSSILPENIEKVDLHDDSEDDDDEDDDDDDDVQGPVIEGIYDPKEFEFLPVSTETKELFKYIICYTPQTIQLEYKLVPFIPEYIPAVGDIDGFLKVARPDGTDDKLGLTVLDEPCANQTEPAVMNLQLRATHKQPSAKPVVVKTIANAEKNPKELERWIKDIKELYKDKPLSSIQYSKPMPDIDSLMQEWPTEFEQKLNEVGLPLDNLNVDLLTYVDIILALFDIPKYESRIESLHVLFTLYTAVVNHHTTDEGNNGSNDQTPSTDNLDKILNTFKP